MAAGLLAAGAAVGFALGLILTQYGLKTVPAWRSGFYTIAAATALAWALAVLFVDWRELDRDAVLLFAAVGCVFPVAVTVLTIHANQALGPAVTGALGNMAPLCAVLGAVLFLGETLGAIQIAGLALIIGGITLIAWRGSHEAKRWAPWMLTLPLVASLIRGLTQPVMKVALALWREPLAASAIGYSSSLLIVWLLVASRARRAGPADPTGVRWFGLVGLANGIATFLLYAALGLGPVTLVAPIVALFPLVAVVLGRLLLRQPALTVASLVGIGTSVGGVMLLLIRSG